MNTPSKNINTQSPSNSTGKAAAFIMIKGVKIWHGKQDVSNLGDGLDNMLFNGAPLTPQELRVAVQQQEAASRVKL